MHVQEQRRTLLPNSSGEISCLTPGGRWTRGFWCPPPSPHTHEANRPTSTDKGLPIKGRAVHAWGRDGAAFPAFLKTDSDFLTLSLVNATVSENEKSQTTVVCLFLKCHPSVSQTHSPPFFYFFYYFFLMTA